MKKLSFAVLTLLASFLMSACDDNRSIEETAIALCERYASCGQLDDDYKSEDGSFDMKACTDQVSNWDSHLDPCKSELLDAADCLASQPCSYEDDLENVGKEAYAECSKSGSTDEEELLKCVTDYMKRNIKCLDEQENMQVCAIKNNIWDYLEN